MWVRRTIDKVSLLTVGNVTYSGDPRIKVIFFTFYPRQNQLFFLSILQWSCIIFAIWLCAYSVGYTATVTMAIAVWILMVIGLTLPSSPAQLGTTQLAFTLGLSIAINEVQIPFAASVVYTCCVNIPYMIIGAFYWLRLSEFRRETQKTESN